MDAPKGKLGKFYQADDIGTTSVRASDRESLPQGGRRIFCRRNIERKGRKIFLGIRVRAETTTGLPVANQNPGAFGRAIDQTLRPRSVTCTIEGP